MGFLGLLYGVLIHEFLQIFTLSGNFLLQHMQDEDAGRPHRKFWF